MAQVIERWSVCGVQVQRSYGCFASEDSGVIGFRVEFHVAVDALFAEPVVGEAARVFAFAQNSAGDFF